MSSDNVKIIKFNSDREKMLDSMEMQEAAIEWLEETIERIKNGEVENLLCVSLTDTTISRFRSFHDRLTMLSALRILEEEVLRD